MNTSAATAPEKKKRNLQDILESKKTGEKMVYMSVPDYTSAKWAEAAGVDVAVVGDSLACITIISIVAGIVLLWPWAIIAKLSPTTATSTPAASAHFADV